MLAISGEWMLLTATRLASYDVGMGGMPLGGFPPNPLSLVLTEGVREPHYIGHWRGLSSQDHVRPSVWEQSEPPSGSLPPIIWCKG